MNSRTDLLDALTSVSDAIADFGRAIKQASSNAAAYTAKSSHAYYNIAGKYTLPIKKESAPSIRELGPAQISLFIIPIIPIAFISSLTWMPLIANNIQSIGRGFAFAANVGLTGLHEDKKIPVPFKGRTVVQEIYGLPGLIIGGVFGGVAAITIGAARGTWFVLSNLFYAGRHFFFQTGKSFYEAFALMANLTSPTKREFYTDRTILDRFVIGSVGGALGLVTGLAAAMIVGVGRGAWFVVRHMGMAVRHFLVQSGKSFYEAFATLANLALHKDYSMPISAEERRLVDRYLIGSIGGLLGGVAGTLAAIVIGVARGAWFALRKTASGVKHVVVQLGLSFIEAYGLIVNLALPEKNKMRDFYKDDRKIYNRYLIGFAGGVLGVAIGGIAATVTLIARGINHFAIQSGWSFIEAFVGIVNLSLSEKYKIKGEPLDRHPVNRFLVGSVGLIFGAVLGSLSALVIGIARGSWYAISKLSLGVKRFFVESAKSAYEAFVLMTNLAMPADYQASFIKERSQLDRFVLGSIGGTIGLVAGGLAASIIAVARGTWATLKHSAITAFFTASYMIEAAYDFKNPNAEGSYSAWAKEEWAKNFIVGFPGLVTGIVVGGIASIAILITRGVCRVIKHSVLSFCEAFTKMANLSLATAYKFGPLGIERTYIEKYLVGSIGGLVGIVTGAIAALVIGIARGAWFVLSNVARGVKHFLVESALSFKEIYVKLVNVALSDKYKLNSDVTERSHVNRFLIGSIGGLFGAVLGSVSLLATAIGRGVWFVLRKTAEAGRYFFFETAKSFSDAFVAVTNLTFPKKNSLYEGRTVLDRYIVGSVGGLLGIITGSVAALVVGIARGIFIATKASFNSWQALSGSFINAAAYREWFQGLRGDTRSNLDKFIGAPGYMLACLMTLPVAFGLLIAKNIPLTVGFVTSFTLTPFVLLAKALARGFSKSKFNLTDQSPVTERRFQDLYSSLSSFGSFKPGQAIQHGDGKEKVGLLFWKSMKLNIKSITEKTLDAMLVAYRQDPKTDFTNAIAALKARYTAGAFTPQVDVDHIHERIEHVSGFVKEYLQDENAKLKPLESKLPPRSMWSSFYAPAETKKQVDADDKNDASNNTNNDSNNTPK